MKTLSMSNISVEAQATHVVAVTQIQHHQQLNHLPSSNTCAKMEHQELEENLESLPDIQEMVEIQEDIVSIPKEIILISLVSQEQALYNPKHEHYRNTQRKDVKWMDIAESVGWAETQCKAKWKAMRDQYCRELKRSKFNAKANVKWKYFKELDFLRPFALSRNYRPRNSANLNNRSSSVSNNINNNNITVHPNATMINATQNNIQDDKKYPNIKIEAGQFNPTEFVAAAQLKTEHRLLSSLTNNQLNVMQQQQSQQQDGTWNYITTTAAAAAAVVLSRSNNEIQIKTSCSGSNNTSNNSMHTTTTTAAPTASDEALYNSFVAQIAQQQQNMLVTAAGQMQQQNHHINPDEEDDDPIHTFLNIESYFEKELITIIQQEDILYNNFHPNYRNVKMKLEVWDEIARKLKKTVKQCRLKWKALRDQYIREHKRLKSRENSESLPRWKHYDALSFLQKYIKHKSGDLDKTLIEIPKTEIDIDMKEPCLRSPKLSPLHVASDLHQQQQQHMQQLQQHGLPSLSGPHNVNNNNNNNNSTQVQNTLQQQLQHSLHQQQHQQHQQQEQQLLQHTHHHNQHQVADEHDEAMCAVACGDVSAYDDMDINDYIIGDGDDGVEDHDGGGRVGVVGGGGPNDDGDAIEDDDEDIDRKSENFPVYSPPVESTVNSNDDHDDDIEMKQQQQQQQHHHQHIVTSFKTSHDGSLTSQAQTSNSHSLSQQSAALQQHLQQHQQQQHHLLQSRQQQQHIVNLSNDETAQTQGQSDHDFTDSLHTSLLNGNVTNATTTTTTTAASVNEVAGFVAGLMGGGGGGAEPSVNAAAATAGYSLASASADDDEVGAFFKAVAMKIRNAKMSPVDFTDLQIDILRLINGTLKNH